MYLIFSLFLGNAYSHFILDGKETIAEHERQLLFVGLGIASLAGSLLLLLLRPRNNIDAGDLTGSHVLYVI